jgi:hypothetical protein
MQAFSTIVAVFATIYTAYAAAYYVTSSRFLGTQHGNAGAWRTVLADLKARFADCDLQCIRETCSVLLPYETTRPNLQQLTFLLAFVDACRNAERRIAMTRNRLMMLLGIGLLTSILFTAVICHPLLFNATPVVEAGIPLFGFLVLTFGALHALVFDWPQSANWSHLQEHAAIQRARLTEHAVGKLFKAAA